MIRNFIVLILLRRLDEGAADRGLGQGGAVPNRVRNLALRSTIVTCMLAVLASALIFSPLYVWAVSGSILGRVLVNLGVLIGTFIIGSIAYAVFLSIFSRRQASTKDRGHR